MASNALHHAQHEHQHQHAGDSEVPNDLDIINPMARLFLRQQYSSIDPRLPGWLEVLSDVGAAECWHKKSSFKAHLLEVYKVLRLWGVEEVVAVTGLMHSAYSNSYVNLAVFQPGTERSRVADLVGGPAEELIHLFCVVPRHDLIYTQLLDTFPPGTPPEQLLAPAAGLTVPHIKTGEPLHLDLATLARFLLLTMADFPEQLHSWQDDMFGNEDGRLSYAGSRPAFLWPGQVRPARWFSAVSRMGRLLRSALEQLTAAGHPAAASWTLPPIFDHCTAVVTEADQEVALDLYCRVCDQLRGPDSQMEALEALERCSAALPWAGEPYLLAAQLHLQAGRWAAAGVAASRGLTRLVEWGTPWDKRMPWEAWLAWGRVLLRGARTRTWPGDAFGMLNLGLVGGI